MDILKNKKFISPKDKLYTFDDLEAIYNKGLCDGIDRCQRIIEKVEAEYGLNEVSE